MSNLNALSTSKIVVVEDSPRLASLMQSHLRDAGFQINTAGTGSRFRTLIKEAPAHLYIIDLGLPDVDGLELIEQCRQAGDDTPILVVTARASVDDRVSGLDSGADDYLIKPFDREELVARVKALLRRSGGAAAVQSRNDIIEAGNLVIELGTELVRLGNVQLNLRPTERRLLCLLARRLGRVVAKESIESALYTLSREVSENAVEQTVSRLRAALKRHETGLAIRTVWGTGYALEGKP